jgi:hypothetical protein
LSQRDLLKVARLAGQNRLADAAVTYAEAALPGWGGATDIASDPAYSGLMKECVYYIFKHAPGHEDYKGNADQVAYLEEYCGDRPPTLSLLAAGWKAYERDKRNGRQIAMLSTEQPMNFELMSNDELERTLQSVNRHINGKK